MRCFLRPSYYGTLAEAICRTIHQNIGSPLICLFYMHAIIRQRYIVFLHSVFLFCTTDFFLSFFLSFICTRPFDKSTWSSFIYSFLCMAIWQKYMVFFHLFFLLCTIIWLKIKVHTVYSLYVHNHSKSYGPHQLIYFICTGPFYPLSFIFALVHDQLTKFWDPHWFFLFAPGHLTNL